MVFVKCRDKSRLNRERYLLGILSLIGFVLAPLTGCTKAVTEVGPPTQVEVDSSDSQLVDYIDSFLQRAQRNVESGLDRGRLAMVYDANGYLDAALDTYAQASQLDGEEMRWPYLLALAHGKAGQLETALEVIEEAIHRDPDYLPSYLVKGFWLLDLGDFERAAEQFQDLKQLTRNEADTIATQVGLTQSLFGQGEFEAAQEALLAMPREANDQPYVKLLRQRIQREIGEGSSDAVEVESTLAGSFSQISWSDPIAGEVVEYTHGLTGETLLAQKLIDGGRVEDGLSMAKSLVERYPDDARPVQLQNAALIKLDRIEDARRMLEESVDRFPNDHLMRFNLGRLLEHSGDLDSALNHYEESMRLRPDFMPSYDAASLLLVQQRKTQEAASVLHMAIEQDPSASDIAYRLGIILGSLGNWLESVEHLQTASDHDQGNPAIWSHLALSLSELQRYEGALAAIQRAISIDSQHPTVVAAVSTLVENGVLELPNDQSN